MPQPATVIDAPSGETVRHGSQIVTFSIAGALVAEDIKVTLGTRKIAQQDEMGKASKNAHVATDFTGTATIQLKAAASGIFRGETFTLADTYAAGTLSCIVTEVSPAWNQSEAVKVNISFNEKLNA